MVKDSWKNNNLLREASNSYKSLGNLNDIDTKGVLSKYFKVLGRKANTSAMNPFSAVNCERYNTYDCHYISEAILEDVKKNRFPSLKEEDYDDIKDNYEEFTPEFTDAVVDLIYKGSHRYTSKGEVILALYPSYIDWEGVEEFFSKNSQIDVDEDGTVSIKL